ncbi:hypothetical protein FRX31_007880 [Thalictrum thalictroides]|uniref:Uncharacterized protein n=1 Tax=Thalictrum thalictroides TaxID=46969 RepID=A0A7J6WZP1_THATH|nr:hypothetical protein FRX31_007880 [Thalictrum thalictroides]
MRIDWKSYCSPFFTVEAYTRVYEGSIRPLLHEDEWPKITEVINPPIKTRGRGRPPIQRKRGFDEGPVRYGGKKQHRCSSYKGFGHNKTSCPGFDADEVNYVSASQGPAKKGATAKGGRPRTRPRKIDYGVPTESIAADPTFNDFIEQFEPVVGVRSKGKKKTYKGKGKKRANTSQTSDASHPFDPSLYGYGTTSAQPHI